MKSIGSNRLMHGYAVCILRREQSFIARSHHGARTDKRHAKAHAFFFRESNNLDREGKHYIPHRFGDFNRHHNAKDAVICPCIGHSIEMRSHHESPGGFTMASTQIPRSIHVDGHSSRLHPFGYKSVGTRHRRRQKRTRRLPGNVRHPRQSSASLHHTLCVGAHCSRTTVASMYPCGSSVGTKISLSLS